MGEALNEIAHQDPEILDAVMAVMETEKLIASNAAVDVLPKDTQVLVSLGSSAQRPQGNRGGHQPPLSFDLEVSP